VERSEHPGGEIIPKKPKPKDPKKGKDGGKEPLKEKKGKEDGPKKAAENVKPKGKTRQALVMHAKVTSHTHDDIKGTDKINLHLTVKDENGDELIATGTNMPLNNMDPEKVKKLCSILGIKKLTATTPLRVELSVMNEDIEKWEEAVGILAAVEPEDGKQQTI